jgi:NAD+ synthase
MSQRKPFSTEIILLEDVESTVNEITGKLNYEVTNSLKRLGVVIGLSGGIDSSVSMALAVKALGPDKVLGIMMPEKDSSPESEILARELADKFGVRTIKENISGALEGFGCYRRRDEAVRQVFPEYSPDTHKMKIGTKKSGLFTSLPPMFSLTIVDNKGNEKEQLLSVDAYLRIVAASNFKQRSRMAMLYFHAEANHFAVLGTPNKQEIEQGFFVKHGDGGADIIPIAHLYKTQVYQLARYLGIPQRIIDRTPTSDTYSAEQTQEEFFFQLPFDQVDLFWYAFVNNYDAGEVGKVMGKTPEQVKSVFRGFERKIKTTEYLRMLPIKF